MKKKNAQTSLAIREIKIKTATSIELGNTQKPENTNVKRDFKKWSLSFTRGGVVNWYNHFCEQYGSNQQI